MRRHAGEILKDPTGPFQLEIRPKEGRNKTEDREITSRTLAHVPNPQESLFHAITLSDSLKLESKLAPSDLLVVHEDKGSSYFSTIKSQLY